MRSALKQSEYTASDALKAGVLALQAERIETASLDARLLLAHALGVSREQLLFRLDAAITREQAAAYDDLIARRAQRQPVSQLLGRREFWGREFIVTGDTLDPRPDSEAMIETILAQRPDRSVPLRILDLGTGTGCLMLSLLGEYPEARGVAVDISEEALAVARKNAERHGMADRVEFRRSRWWEHVGESFDIIAANPPYILTDVIPQLHPEVSEFEPMVALDGGTDGLVCYREIALQLADRLAPGGIAAFELGTGMQQGVCDIITSRGLQVAAVRQDLQGIPRCIVFQHNTNDKG